MLVKKGRIVIEKVESTLLKENPLMDPYTRELFVYLPPSYESGNQKYPVVYCLAGYTGSARSWFNFQAWIPTIDERMDRLMNEGVGEMILVFPDCFTRLGGSQYLDSLAVGAYRSFLLKEVIPFVDRTFRTKQDRRFRGVMGKSSGGYGAITISMEHPELFSAVACHSGDMYFEYAYLHDFPVALRQLEKWGGLKGFFEKFNQIPKTGMEDHALMGVVAMSACYSPNSKKPFLFELPFDETTGELDAAVWKKWKEKDPVEIVRNKAAHLKDFGVVYLDCGSRDEFSLNFGARIFSRDLQRNGISHKYEEFENGHFNTQYRYDISLRKLAEYFW